MPKLNATKGVAPGAELLNTSFSELASSRESWRAADKAHREAHGETSRSPQEAKNYRSAKSANLTPEQRISRYLERLEAVLSRSPERRQSEAPHTRLQQRLINEAVIDITNEALVGKIAHGLFLSESARLSNAGTGVKHNRWSLRQYARTTLSSYTKSTHSSTPLFLSGQAISTQTTGSTRLGFVTSRCEGL